ncbi:ATP-binding cassette domain-containing protein [Cellulomonas telluris]|uniref:ATP-binding cassette domain-containing protein n=1 Tax=Cellulomonas telluris TaxID=2306636 RepID=UPI0010A7B05D|nr:ATP-binding cassette domain-containing protein [Cellulomonas telluris]
MLGADRLALPGGVHFLVGRNGSGKSSLLRVLAGLERPREGTVRLDGAEVSGAAAWRDYRAVSGYLHQDFAVRGRASVRAFARYGAWLRGVAADELESRTAEVLATVGLTDRAEARASRLSGGMQRRLGLAVELSNRPHVYLLDEPTSGLDFEARDAVHDVVTAALDAGAVVVVASHDDHELNRYPGATYHVLEDGRLVESVTGDGAVTVQQLLGGGR